MKPPPIAPITFHKRMPRGEPSITLTAAAAQQIHAAAEASDAKGLALRIAARRDADGTIDYQMGFDNARKGDVALESAGIDLVVGDTDAELLDGMTLDYVEYEPGDFRFIFINPNERGGVPDNAGTDAGSAT
jgi:iron-sulfur cluster assembly protein